MLTMGYVTMSEYLNAEIHETPETIEVRWDYNGRVYGLVMGQEMFDLLEITSGNKSPVLSRIRMNLNNPTWNHGVEITEEGFNQL